MNNYDPQPQNAAERVISDVFGTRMAETDSQVARLRLDNQLKRREHRPRVRNWLKAAAFVTALVLLGGWASGLPLPAYGDAQQITIAMPDTFSPASYPRWVAIFANHSESLKEAGGHSLVVDYVQGPGSEYYLKLGIIGIGYSEANEWIRGVMADVPEIDGTPYALTQPLVPYTVTVRDMIAYSLGSTEAVERNVALAWLESGSNPKHIFLISRPKEYAERVSNVLY
jgi:hypothetical protein